MNHLQALRESTIVRDSNRERKKCSWDIVLMRLEIELIDTTAGIDAAADQRNTQDTHG